AHFKDPNPDPDVAVALIVNIAPVNQSKWQQIVLNYLEYTSLSMPPETIPAVESALDGPYYEGAIRELAKLKPLPEDVLRDLLAFMQKTPNVEAKRRVMNWLSRYGVTDARFVQVIVDVLSGPDKGLYDVAALAAATVGPAA